MSSELLSAIIGGLLGVIFALLVYSFDRRAK